MTMMTNLESLSVLAPTQAQPWYGRQLSAGVVAVIFGFETNRHVAERFLSQGPLVVNDGYGWIEQAA